MKTRTFVARANFGFYNFLSVCIKGVMTRRITKNVQLEGNNMPLHSKHTITSQPREISQSVENRISTRHNSNTLDPALLCYYTGCVDNKKYTVYAIFSLPLTACVNNFYSSGCIKRCKIAVLYSFFFSCKTTHTRVCCHASGLKAIQGALDSLGLNSREEGTHFLERDWLFLLTVKPLSENFTPII